MGRHSHNTVLTGDVGGTNTRLTLLSIPNDNVRKSHDEIRKSVSKQSNEPGALVLNKKFRNEDYKSFLQICQLFLEEAEILTPPISACFAVAGPVNNNTVTFTNRADWVVDGEELAKELGILKVRLVNDFVAQGYGLLTLNEEHECIQLQGNRKDYKAPIACIGAGTGLGECFLTPDASGFYHCFPSEGGHAEFAPRNDLEVSLLLFLKTKFQQKHRVSVERVVSGTGLGNVYEFLSTFMPEKVDPVLHSQIMSAAHNKGAVIATHKDSSELCLKVMEIFATAYGSEAGVAALKFMPFGGLYLSGGLTPKNIDLIQDPTGPFLQAFNDKGRVSAMLQKIPLFAVMVEDAGERGAQLLAFTDLYELRNKDSQPSHKNSSAPPLHSNNTTSIAVASEYSMTDTEKGMKEMAIAAALEASPVDNNSSQHHKHSQHEQQQLHRDEAFSPKACQLSALDPDNTLYDSSCRAALLVQATNAAMSGKEDDDEEEEDGSSSDEMRARRRKRKVNISMFDFSYFRRTINQQKSVSIPLPVCLAGAALLVIITATISRNWRK